jgi:hypothetical protein
MNDPDQPQQIGYTAGMEIMIALIVFAVGYMVGRDSLRDEEEGKEPAKPELSPVELELERKIRDAKASARRAAQPVRLP